jgi:hypothetical protein
LAGLKDVAPEAAKGFSMLTAAAKKKVAQQVKSSRKPVAQGGVRGALRPLMPKKKSLAKATKRKKG